MPISLRSAAVAPALRVDPSTRSEGGSSRLSGLAAYLQGVVGDGGAKAPHRFVCCAYCSRAVPREHAVGSLGVFYCSDDEAGDDQALMAM